MTPAPSEGAAPHRVVRPAVSALFGNILQERHPGLTAAVVTEIAQAHEEPLARCANAAEVSAVAEAAVAVMKAHAMRQRQRSARPHQSNPAIDFRTEAPAFER